MKRIGVIVCLIIMAVSMLAPACFAANVDAAGTPGKSNFKIVSSTPENNSKGVSVENLSVKIYFDTDMLPSNSIRKANLKQFRLTDANGKKIPVKVYYSHKEEGLLMVVSDTIDNNITIQGNTGYTLKIGKGLQSADGTRLGTDEKITFKTLDQSKSTRIYMIMMGVMIVGMIFFTSRSAKKEAEKQKQASSKQETVNPYKEAKRTGKSVEEIVKKDEERKAKQAAIRAKQRAADEELEESLSSKKKVSPNKRVSAPNPIAAAGSAYRVKVVTTKPAGKNASGSNNKNGKKNSGKKKH